MALCRSFLPPTPTPLPHDAGQGRGKGQPARGVLFGATPLVPLLTFPLADGNAGHSKPSRKYKRRRRPPRKVHVSNKRKVPHPLQEHTREAGPKRCRNPNVERRTDSFRLPHNTGGAVPQSKQRIYIHVFSSGYALGMDQIGTRAHATHNRRKSTPLPRKRGLRCETGAHPQRGGNTATKTAHHPPPPRPT